MQAGLGLWARHWRQLALVSFLLTGVTTIALALVDPGPGLGELIRAYRDGEVPSELDQPSGPAQALSLLSGAVLGPIALLATARIVFGACAAEAPPTGLAVRYGLRRIASTWWLLIATAITLAAVAIPALIVGMILVAAGLAPLAIVAVVPILYVGARVGIPLLGAFVVDDARGFGAVGRAWRLAEGRWWSLIGAMCLVVLLSLALAIVALVLGLLVTGEGRAAAVATAALNVAVNAVVGPIGYAVAAVLYLDLRARREWTSPDDLVERIVRHDPP